MGRVPKHLFEIVSGGDQSKKSSFSLLFSFLCFASFFPFSIQIQRHCFCLFLHSLFLTQLWLLEPELISGIWSLINNEVASSSKVSYEQLYEMDLKTNTMDSCSCDYSWCCWRVGIAIIITYYYLLLIASGFFLLGLCSFLETCSGSMMKHTTQCILCVWRGSMYFVCLKRIMWAEATQRSNSAVPRFWRLARLLIFPTERKFPSVLCSDAWNRSKFAASCKILWRSSSRLQPSQSTLDSWQEALHIDFVLSLRIM